MYCNKPVVIENVYAHLQIIDDDTFIASEPVMREIVVRARALHAETGGVWNEEKCKIWSVAAHIDPDGFWGTGGLNWQIVAPGEGLNLAHEDGNVLGLLGAFLGSEQRISEKLLDIVQSKIVPSMRRVVDVAKESLQLAVSLLQSVHVPRMVYLLRLHTPAATLDAARCFDAAMREVFEAMLGYELMDDDWDRATLPLRFAGLGLRSMERTRHAAFLASFCGVLRPGTGAATKQPLLKPILDDLPSYFVEGEGDGVDVELLPRFQAMRMAHAFVAERAGWDLDGDDPETPLLSKLPGTQFAVKNGQKKLSDLVEKAEYVDQLLRPDARHANEVEFTDDQRVLALARKQAWWKSCGGAGSSGVFTVGPRDADANVGVDLSNAQFLFAIELQLYLPLTVCVGLPRTCSCSDEIGVRGYHLLKCTETGANTELHDTINHFLARMLRSIGLMTVLEPQCRYPMNEKARADGECPFLRQEGPTEYDVKVQCVLSENGQRLHAAAERPGHCAHLGEREKFARYQEHGIEQRDDGVKLFPLVFEMGGRRGKHCTNFLRCVADFCESSGWGPKWKFWLTEAPKINAVMVKALFQKVSTLACRTRSLRDYRGPPAAAEIG